MPELETAYLLTGEELAAAALSGGPTACGGVCPA